MYFWKASNLNLSKNVLKLVYIHCTLTFALFIKITRKYINCTSNIVVKYNNKIYCHNHCLHFICG